MSRRQMCKKSKSPQKTRDLATLAALEAKHQNLVQKINSLLPLLLVALPPFVVIAYSELIHLLTSASLIKRLNLANFRHPS